MQKIPYQDIATKDAAEALALFGSDSRGLTEEEANRRRAEYGANELENDRTHWYEVFFRQFKSAFIYLLLAASAVALFQHEYIDAGLIFLFLTLNAALGFYQEYRAEKALSLLKTFVDRKTRVRRNPLNNLPPFGFSHSIPAVKQCSVRMGRAWNNLLPSIWAGSLRANLRILEGSASVQIGQPMN